LHHAVERIEKFPKLRPLKEMLIKEGYTFKSQTDSEVVSNLLAHNYKKNNNVITTINETVAQLEGTWGLVIMCVDNEDELYCTKNGSPLLIGQTDNYVMATSEQSGFNEKIKNYIVLNNYDVCVIKRDINKIIIHVRCFVCYIYNIFNFFFKSCM
jgi:glucosamine--fructose-6-phosphate aminotransferase (isomerizing)